MPTGTVSRVGNGRAVFIPSSLAVPGFDVGDKVDIEASGDTIVIRPRSAPARHRLEALDQLTSFADALPDAPWDDDSREADRALAGERYV